MIAPAASVAAPVWVDPFGSSSAASCGEVVRALRAQGVNAGGRAAAPGGAGVILFDDISAELCHLIRAYSNDGLGCVIAVHTSSGLASGALWRLLEAGATDVFAWDPRHGAAAVAARIDRWQRVDDLLALPSVRDQLVGESPSWKSVLRQVVEIARFSDSPVLVTGESGTGKELVARLIHALDARTEKRDLVLLDCTTIVPTLSGSEFFGHERGAFTGADSTREGAFALADGGTLFLDEVGELPPTLQAELLRVVQEGTYKRVGGNRWRTTGFRLVCATNKDLIAEAAEQRFRSDFYYRIAAWRIDLPSLRERREDILPLTHHFLRQLRMGQETCSLDHAVVEYLVRRNYPGNVRDLRHLVTRMSQRHVGPGPITLGEIPEEERERRDEVDWRDDGLEQSIRTALVLGAGLKEITGAAAETAIRVAIGEEGGNLQRASSRLGITARALQLRRAAEQRNGQPTGN